MYNSDKYTETPGSANQPNLHAQYQIFTAKTSEYNSQRKSFFLEYKESHALANSVKAATVVIPMFAMFFSLGLLFFKVKECKIAVLKPPNEQIRRKLNHLNMRKSS